MLHIYFGQSLDEERSESVTKIIVHITTGCNINNNNNNNNNNDDNNNNDGNTFICRCLSRHTKFAIQNKVVKGQPAQYVPWG